MRGAEFARRGGPRSSALGVISTKRAPGMVAARVCARQADGRRPRLVPSTSVGTAIAAASARRRRARRRRCRRAARRSRPASGRSKYPSSDARLSGASRARPRAVSDAAKRRPRLRRRMRRAAAGDLRERRDVGGRRRRKPCRARQHHRRDPVRMACRDPQRNRRAHRYAADDKSARRPPVGRRRARLLRTWRIRRGRDTAERRSAVAAAFERQPAIPVAVGKHLARSAPRRRLAHAGRRPAARRPHRGPRDGVVAARADRGHASVPRGSARNAATAGASRPPAHGSPAGHRNRSRAGCATKSPEVDDPCPAAAKRRRHAGPWHGPWRYGRQVTSTAARRSRAASTAVARSNRFAGSSTIAKRARAELVDQPHGVGRRGDDVGQLRLDAEIDAVRFGEHSALAISATMSCQADRSALSG